MTTARSTLRQAVSKLDKSYISGSTTTNITTNDQVVDSKLEGIGHHNDNSLKGSWIWINTTSNAEVERVIQANTGSTGAITVRGANLAAESGSASIEIHQRFRPSDIHNAIDYAINTELQNAFQEVEDTTLHTHPLQTVYPLPSGIKRVHQVMIENKLGPDFEYNILSEEGCSVDFSGWDVSTRPNGSDAASNITLSHYGGTDQQDKFHMYDDWCKAVSGSSAGYHYWNVLDTPANFGGIKLTYQEPVYCLTADEVKLTIVDNNGSTLSSYHDGTGLKLMTVTHSVTDSPTSIQCGVTTAGNSVAFYRGQAILSRAESYLSNVWSEIGDWQVYGGNLRFLRRAPSAHRFLMLVGTKAVSSLSADTDTIELSEPEVEVITHAAVLKLYQDLMQDNAYSDKNPYRDVVAYWNWKLGMVKQEHGMKSPVIRMPRQM